MRVRGIKQPSQGGDYPGDLAKQLQLRVGFDIRCEPISIGSAASLGLAPDPR